MSPHRVPGEIDPRPDGVPLHVGPRDTCPACGAHNFARCPKDGACVDLPLGAASPFHPNTGCRNSWIQMVAVERVTLPRFCSPSARVRVGWFRRCHESGEHTHQRCKACGATWICAPLEPVGDASR